MLEPTTQLPQSLRHHPHPPSSSRLHSRSGGLGFLAAGRGVSCDVQRVRRCDCRLASLRRSISQTSVAMSERAHATWLGDQAAHKYFGESAEFALLRSALLSSERRCTGKSLFVPLFTLMAASTRARCTAGMSAGTTPPTVLRFIRVQGPTCIGNQINQTRNFTKLGEDSGENKELSSYP